MPKVLFRFAYGDFPQYQQGDLEEHPSEALLQAAANSNCLEIIPDDEPNADPDEN